MGSASTSHLKPPHFPITSYVPLPHPNPLLQNNPALYSILKHKTSNTFLQEYNVTIIDEDELQRAFEFFQWRLRQEHIVNTMYFFFNQSKRICSESYHGSLYIERIPLKLRGIGGIPYPENLYVLQSVLKGFGVLGGMFGCFEPTESMVGVDTSGRVKVWLNDNLSLNYPEKGVDADMTQHEMTRRVLEIVERNSERTQDREDAASYCLRRLKEGDGFGEAERILGEYVKYNKVEIPDRFDCIMELLSGKEDGQKQGRYGRRMSKEKISLNSSGAKKASEFSFKSPQVRRQQTRQRTVEKVYKDNHRSMYQPKQFIPVQRSPQPQPQPQPQPKRQNLQQYYRQRHHPSNQSYPLKSTQVSFRNQQTHTKQISKNSSQIHLKPPTPFKPQTHSRQLSQNRLTQSSTPKRLTVIPPLNLTKPDPITQHSSCAQQPKIHLSQSQTVYTESKTSLLQHSEILTRLKPPLNFKTVESVESKENLNRYVISEALLSSININYDEISYRSRNERFKIDPQIARDLQVYGFR